MSQVRLAHVREQGIDLIIVPVEPKFARMTEGRQRNEISQLQRHAVAAGLAGGVVAVWETANGGLGFAAPPNWHPFFKSVNWGWVTANLNRELSW